ncbi:hypothetical protein TRAPUB_6377 [Trametes pubescens]|uniref:Uncharacterized protein n=1 Tax=Trametes pubescens TaxID=154538 RepID=A0A1M2V632_TRAPU|nr:hypothetical protein TRAPUB_6377 [Trametes pubescens]
MSFSSWTAQDAEIVAARSKYPTKSSCSPEASGSQLLEKVCESWFVVGPLVGRRSASNATNADVEAKDDEKYQVGVVRFPECDSLLVSGGPLAVLTAYIKNVASDFKTTSLDYVEDPINTGDARSGKADVQQVIRQHWRWTSRGPVLYLGDSHSVFASQKSSRTDRTTTLSECSSGIENSKVSFEGSSSVACTTLFSPSFGDDLWNVFKEDVQKTDGVDANLRENVSLSRRCEEQKNRRVRSDVVLKML